MACIIVFAQPIQQLVNIILYNIACVYTSWKITRFYTFLKLVRATETLLLILKIAPCQTETFICLFNSFYVVARITGFPLALLLFYVSIRFSIIGALIYIK